MGGGRSEAKKCKEENVPDDEEGIPSRDIEEGGLAAPVGPNHRVCSNSGGCNCKRPRGSFLPDPSIWRGVKSLELRNGPFRQQLQLVWQLGGPRNAL